eukprot:505695_1
MEFALMLLISFSDQLFVNYCTSLNQSDMVTRSNTATTIVKYITNGKIDELKLELIKKLHLVEIMLENMESFQVALVVYIVTFGVNFALICDVVTGVYANLKDLKKEIKQVKVVKVAKKMIVNKLV